jgi:hypothetical protein
VLLTLRDRCAGNPLPYPLTFGRALDFRHDID